MPDKSYTMKYFVLACLFATPLLGEDAASIVRRSVERDRVNFERARDYTFLERTAVREYDGRGRLKKSESETFDVLMLGGRPYKRLTAKDDRPLTPAEAAKAEATFEKEMRKRQTETEKQRAAQAAKEEKQRREARAFLTEIPEAFDFRMAGEEKVDGLPVWVIDAEPRAGFKSKVKRGSLLSKFRGRISIAQGDLQWVRVEAETIDTVSFGLFLARLGPGARLSFEQRRVNDEVWLPSRATTRLDARVALLKRFNAEVDVEWMQYRKFQTDSRVVEAAELTAEPEFQ
ncbi:MAG: hypothetical protein M9913_18245 [Bryobacteraceae bacterium]|nr:hypothetical protein [Solibacteraceae bacterium]MCO5352807.1 hypothetical protein [Bryobacteraceae bacterium]